MEVPLRLAVQVRRPADVDLRRGASVRVEGRRGVRAADGRLFPVEAAVEDDSPQEADLLYSCICEPQLACFLDGADASLVAFGARRSGKTRALLGDDSRQGIVPRFVRDAFARLDGDADGARVVHLTWTRLVEGGVADLLGCGLARCSTLDEALAHLDAGRRRAERLSELDAAAPCHTVFTMSVERRWTGADGLLRHRLSTASFCELAARPEPSLARLDAVVAELLDGRAVDYERSLLTAMLRDSFGGRAFTWLLCCLDADPDLALETLDTLESAWRCRGVRNVVTVNAFADSGAPPIAPPPSEPLGARFVRDQWMKLAANAEGLFRAMLRSGVDSLSAPRVAEINEWLFLKAECDERLPDEEPSSVADKTALPRIAEDTEPSEPSDEDSDDSDASLRHDDFLFADKLRKRTELFRAETDELALEKCDEALRRDDASASTEVSTSLPSVGGRRRSVRAGDAPSEGELDALRRAAADALSPASRRIVEEEDDPEPKLVQRELLKMIDSPAPTSESRKLDALARKYELKRAAHAKLAKSGRDAEAQLKELVALCVAERQLVQDLTKIVERQKRGERNVALDEDAKKAKANLSAARAKLASGDRNDQRNIRAVQKCKTSLDELEKRLVDRELGKRLDADGVKEIKKREANLKAYKKQIEQLKKQMKRDEKRRATLELELAKDKMKLEEMRNHNKLAVSHDDKMGGDKKQASMKQVSVRLSNLDNILMEKTIDLQNRDLSDDKESMLRREIRNLRKTRECLMDQRCVLGHKRKTQRSLSDTEERKFLEYEEAIEAIDTAIEFKNELICGRSHIVLDTESQNERGERERGEELLMARLSKLSSNEMRTLLYKYFQKVIDLRTTCTALEAATGVAQQEASGWRRRCGDAWAALQHARLAHARRTTTLTARHYHTMNQLMNELHGEADSDGNSLYNNAGNNRIPLSLEYGNQLNHHHRLLESSDLENVMTTQHSRIAATTAKIKLRENLTEHENTRVLNRIQVARFHQSAIPSQNLKQLQVASDPTTKVTRQKNKLVITQEDKLNK